METYSFVKAITFYLCLTHIYFYSIFSWTSSSSQAAASTQSASMSGQSLSSSTSLLSVYPIKIVYKTSKSRTLFVTEELQRQQIIKAILNAQGFRDQIDQYEIEADIGGEQSCNQVSLATHKVTGQRVAIKVVNNSQYERLAEENHISECDAMRSCPDSDHVVRLVEEFRINRQVFIVTKYASGGDLLSHTQSLGVRQLPEDVTRHIAWQVAQSLQKLHDVGIAHRDVKHLNIFLKDKSSHPKVCLGDFGLACKLLPRQKIIKLAGTTAFMAPEVIREEPSDFKVDVWSLGVITYSLACGRLPFSSKDRDETQAKILNQEVSFQQSEQQKVSPECQLLLRCMLDKNPETRYTID